MAHNARKTEHAGPKKGAGAYYGHKAEAKHESSRKRRRDGRRVVDEQVADPPEDTTVD